MRTTILSFCLLCGLGLATAQGQTTGVVGINTINPQGMLHIDGAGNNPTSEPVDETASDDVIINSNGQIGVWPACSGCQDRALLLRARPPDRGRKSGRRKSTLV
jgi:hypothetical protein